MQVARGGMLSSPLVLQQVPWTVDDYTFHSVFWVLSLTAFDVVIDMDWLEAYCRMQIRRLFFAQETHECLPVRPAGETHDGGVVGSQDHLERQ